MPPTDNRLHDGTSSAQTALLRPRRLGIPQRTYACRATQKPLLSTGAEPEHMPLLDQLIVALKMSVVTIQVCRNNPVVTVVLG